MVHKLIGEVIRFGRNAHGDVVAARGLGKGHQVRHRLTDTRTRLDNAMGARNERIPHLERHRNLLIARLVGGIHTIDQTARGIVGLNFLAARHFKDRQLVRIHAVVCAICLENICTSGAEREDGPGVLSSQEREDGTVRPRYIGMHIGQAGHKALRQISERHEQHAPYAAQGVDVGVGAVRHRVAAKQIGHKGQFVRGKPRKRDARQRQRIDPDIAHIDAALNRLDKRAVEGGIVRDHRATTDKIGESGDSLNGRRGIGHIGICNARELGNLGRNQLLGMHEGIETVNDLAARKTGRRDLDKFVILHRQTGGLGIEDNDVFLDKTERLRLGALGKRGIGIYDKLRRSRRYGVLD